MTSPPGLSTDASRPAELRHLPWAERMSFVVETMRELSLHTDPQLMVQAYSKRMRRVMPSDGFMSLSRRNLPRPQFRITRSSRFTDNINPWKQSDLLPLLEGGLLSELIYGEEPVIIDDLKISAHDPAATFLAGHGSLCAVPLFDGGESINMVVQLRRDRSAFDREGLPEQVWLANLFGRATTNLVLSHEVKEAYEAVDREMKAVADIQKSLLPAQLPEIPGLDVAAYYQTSKRAGGDYYDFFPLAENRWGILIADVSGHGTPAAVLMAITHSIAHTAGGLKQPPGNLLGFVNERLATAYTNGTGNFVTAFYGIWDPATRELAFASAGHPPPRVRHANGQIEPLTGNIGLPLGIIEDETFPDNRWTLRAGDTLVLYTDGITEARNARGDMYEYEGLDGALAPAARGAGATLQELLDHLHQFSGGRPPGDDRTLLVAKVR